jgi:archaellum component FlaD/FlaE
MSKSTNFTGQPILNQLLMFIDKGTIRKIAAKHQSDRYVKKFTTYNHLVVMLFIAFEGYQSIREAILGLLANGRCCHSRISGQIRSVIALIAP